MDNTPIKISAEEWLEILQIQEIREAWGLTDETPEEFANWVYGVKFDFVSGSPGFVGDLYILQGDALTGFPPITLIRDETRVDENHPKGYLEVLDYE